jgi:hypothetical protein
MQGLGVATRRYHALRLPLLSARKNQRGRFNDFLEVGWADFFGKSRLKKGTRSARKPRSLCAFHACA